MQEDGSTYTIKAEITNAKSKPQTQNAKTKNPETNLNHRAQEDRINLDKTKTLNPKHKKTKQQNQLTQYEF